MIAWLGVTYILVGIASAKTIEDAQRASGGPFDIGHAVVVILAWPPLLILALVLAILNRRPG